MQITIFAVIVWATAIFIGSLGVVIFLGSKNLSSRAFAHSILWLTMWTIAIGFFVSSHDYVDGFFYAKLTYFLGTSIACAFLYFFATYPDDIRPNPKLTLFLLILQCFLAYLIIFTDKIVHDVFPLSYTNQWGWHFGSLSLVFEFVFFSSFLYGIVILYQKYNKCIQIAEKNKLKLMLLSIIVGTFPPSLLSIILPRLGIFDYNWLGAVSQMIWIPIMAYSIIRYRQMNVRAVVTEVLAIAMAAIFFVNIFIDTPFGIWGRVVTFVAFLVLVYFLIRGVLQEARQRDELRDLNLNLETRVAAQTVEIRRSLETEKHARQELEKLNDAKDQFIMITQHHLRTPVVSMNWALESASKGEYGRLTKDLKPVLEETLSSGKRLMRIVDDFLNITAIKIGTNILNIKRESLGPAMVDILSELKEPIAKMSLKVMMPDEANDRAADRANWPELPVDSSKMREALFIVMENAVRYNQLGGKIDIKTRVESGSDSSSAGKFVIEIENNGLGISKEESEKIGSALFYRGEFARKAYPIGMGVGLSVVKAIIRAHKGEFKIESSGKGSGAKVIVVLPM